MMNRVLVFGSSGQVGTSLKTQLEDQQNVFINRDQVDLENLDAIEVVLEETNPQVVINAAAYTAVDKAETEPSLAMMINGEAPGCMARWCQKRSIPFVHYSTDYVFDGSGEKFWTESDETRPLNVYGRSKLRGEELVQQAGGSYLIFRTSWVYSFIGNNFVRTMLELAKEREELKIVCDQTGSPTYAPDLAAATLLALENALRMSYFPSGVYHLAGTGTTSWYGFALKIFELAKSLGWELKVQNVEPIPTHLFPRPATRPLNSRLDQNRSLEILKIKMANWESSLRKCLVEIRSGSMSADL